jgi:hypothetical protein
MGKDLQEPDIIDTSLFKSVIKSYDIRGVFEDGFFKTNNEKDAEAFYNILTFYIKKYYKEEVVH